MAQLLGTQGKGAVLQLLEGLHIQEKGIRDEFALSTSIVLYMLMKPS